MIFTFTQRSFPLALKKVFAALCLLLVCFNGFGQVRYTWRPSNGSASWADGNNWNPARTAPAANDVLVFDGAQTPTAAVTLDFDANTSPVQAVGQLLFINKVQAIVSTAANRTLTLGALPPAIGFQVGAESGVQITSTLGSSALALQLVPEAHASIAGRLDFTSATTSNSAHTLSSGTSSVAGTAEAIEFLSGSYFKAGPKLSGSPFGSLKNNGGTVVLRDGATCEQASGTTPFGGRTYDALVCKAGSTFLYTSSGNTNDISLSGHTFGNLVLNTTRTAVTSTYGTTGATILNDLTITSGAHTLDVVQLDLKGNLYLNGGSLSFPPIANNSLTLILSGAGAQVIRGTVAGTLTFPINVTLEINNAAGLTLQRQVQVNGALTLTNGLLTTTAANSLTLGPGATTSGGSATCFVNGPLSRVLATASTATDLFFPIGSGTAYRPLTLQAEQTDATATAYTAQQFNQAPTVRAMPTAAGSLQRVSAVRYVNVTNSGAANFKQGTITLNYGNDDKVDAPAKLRIAKSDNAGNWLDLGGTGSGAPAGSIASTVPFTSFSDFVLASTEAAGGPGNNPLPVSLASFTAHRGLAGVRLRWATATERNNSHFEVQRSLGGQIFTVLNTLPGHGNSTTVQEYTWLDEVNGSNSLVYYRLRQVDADNTGTYSPVVAVQTSPAAAGVFPNPACDQLNFHAAAGDTYRLLDMVGRPALIGKATAGLNALNLSNLGPGIYYLEVVGAQGRVRYRVIKNGAGR